MEKTWQEFQLVQKKHHIQLLTPLNADYPKLLREIAWPPFLLYCRGNIKLLNSKRLVSMIGSRKATAYGQRVVQDAVEQLVRFNFVTVSGLAFGIDGETHKQTLNFHGKTIAVLGTSVLDEEIYPAINLGLAKEILKNNGLLISEYAPGTISYPKNFPERNRIIAGLAPATIVVEANKKSGSLITARFARENNREVFAVPGDIFSQRSSGTNWLIEQGATPWLSCASLFSALEYLRQNLNTDQENITSQNFSPAEKEILACFEGTPLTLEALTKKSEKTISEIMQLVTALVLKTALHDCGNGQYVK